jgi:CheY-like chemotaxis protein
MANERILIVQNDPDMVTALRLPLESAGYEVVNACSSQEGLEKVKDAPPDLIILDAAMETASGPQLSLQLRSPDPRSEVAAHRHIPILMLTAPHTAASLRSGPDEVSLPVDEVVDTPLDPDLLLKKVQALIEPSR